MTAQPTKILLIYPPSRTQCHYSCPMGMLMLAAVLENAGCQVRLLDANAVGRPLTADDIAALASQLWHARGCPEGSPQQDWFHAVEELRSRAFGH